LTLTGTGVSVPTGQVSSVCTDTVAVRLRLLCITEEFAVETTEAAVCLGAFVGCSERAAFLASGNEMPLSTLSCCTRFSSFHFGQSRDEAVGTFLMVAAAHSFVASFPTFRTYSNVLAGFGAVAVFLAL